MWLMGCILAGEQFFTDKPVNVGKGPGLTLADTALQRIDGGIKYENHEGEGASVSLRIPKKRSGYSGIR